MPLRQAQRQAQRDETLLGAVVQVAFQPAPLLVPDAQQPGPAGLHVSQGGRDFKPQPADLHEQSGRVGDLAEELARRRSVRVDDADLPSVQNDRRAVVSGVYRLTRRVEEPRGPGHHEPEAQRGIGQSGPQNLFELLRATHSRARPGTQRLDGRLRRRTQRIHAAIHLPLQPDPQRDKEQRHRRGHHRRYRDRVAADLDARGHGDDREHQQQHSRRD